MKLKNLDFKKEYITNDDNSVRYVLGKYATRPLIVFGINPSVATAEKTITQLVSLNTLLKSEIVMDI